MSREILIVLSLVLTKTHLFDHLTKLSVYPPLLISVMLISGILFE